jgi:hypothetical protein
MVAGTFCPKPLIAHLGVDDDTEVGVVACRSVLRLRSFHQQTRTPSCSRRIAHTACQWQLSLNSTPIDVRRLMLEDVAGGMVARFHAGQRRPFRRDHMVTDLVACLVPVWCDAGFPGVHLLSPMSSYV